MVAPSFYSEVIVLVDQLTHTALGMLRQRATLSFRSLTL